jgi:hypothetical protein
LPKASDFQLEPPAVQRLLEANKNAASLAQEVIKRTNERMLATVNRQRRDLQFQVGDLLLLSTANKKLPLGTKRVKKFAPKFIGPFEVLQHVADGRAYRIDLPSHMRLHPTFHVSSLTPYVLDTASGRAQAVAKPDYFADGHHEFEVEAILDHRKVQRQLQYFVSWVVMPNHENAWLAVQWITPKNLSRNTGTQHQHSHSKQSDVVAQLEDELRLKGGGVITFTLGKHNMKTLQ